MKETLLLIEDEKIMRITLEDALKRAGYEVASFESGTEALTAFAGNSFDAVITDVRLPDIDGFDVVKEIARKSDTPVIVMTAFGTIKDAVEAMKLGAFDYITKPFALDEFLLIIDRTLEVKRLREENVRLRKDVTRCYSAPNIIGEGEAMKRVFSLMEKVSSTDSTVLILGESGTGKELIATAIHYQSARRERALIKVNCAALPEGLIESELFGHVKGAFTGAVKAKHGRFELAHGGTIFLDEIGDLPLATQSKLLRIIQERTFERVGGTETLSTDVRIIAATNKSLEEQVKSRQFREDLYYRLNVIPILLPPLRERKEDIPLLVDFLLRKCRKKIERNVRFSDEALEALLLYDYPGNVRELENIIERCVTLAGSELIGKEELPQYTVRSGIDAGRISLSDVSAEAEKEHIMRILAMTKWNKTKAAEMLGISRKTLWEKMNNYCISS